MLPQPLDPSVIFTLRWSAGCVNHGRWLLVRFKGSKLACPQNSLQLLCRCSASGSRPHIEIIPEFYCCSKPLSNTVFTRDFVSAYPKNVLIGNPPSPTAIPWCFRKARRPPKHGSVYSGIFLALRASLVTPVGRRGIFRFYQSRKQIHFYGGYCC